MPDVGTLLRQYFETFGEASPTDVHRWLVEAHQSRLRAAAIPGAEARTEELVELVNHAVSYRGVVKWFYILRQLGVLELARQEPAHGFPKNFWRVVSPSHLEAILPGAGYRVYPSNFWGEGYNSARRRGVLEFGRAIDQGEAHPVGKWATASPIGPDWPIADPTRGTALGPRTPRRELPATPPRGAWYAVDPRNAVSPDGRWWGPFDSEEMALQYADSLLKIGGPYPDTIVAEAVYFTLEEVQALEADPARFGFQRTRVAVPLELEG